MKVDFFDKSTTKMIFNIILDQLKKDEQHLFANVIEGKVREGDFKGAADTVAHILNGLYKENKDANRKLFEIYRQIKLIC